MTLVQRVAARAFAAKQALRLKYHVAAKALVVGDQQKAAPQKVDDLFKEVKDGNPGYTDEQAWATAWSVYCKHVSPGSDHCHEPTSQYLKEAEVTRPTPLAGEASIERPTPTAAKAHDFKKGEKVKVTKGKYKGLTGVVDFVGSGPGQDQVSVDLDHPVHKMMGPAIISPNDIAKA